MKKEKRRDRKGFTMVELMAVLIILGLLATVLVSNFMGKVDKGRVITTKVNLRMLHSAVTQFKMDTGRFPTEEEGLMALIEPPSEVEGYQPGGYLETTDVPRDAWGREFIYGEEGGEGYDEDLYSTDAS
jgi:general secretion pathway protein G